jgi:hypothetical protein
MNILPIPSRKTQGKPNLPLATTSKVNAAFCEFKVLMIRISLLQFLNPNRLLLKLHFGFLFFWGGKGLSA